jgi:hypothetical protein
MIMAREGMGVRKGGAFFIALFHRMTPLKGRVISGAALFFLTFYLLQHATLAPNDADGALILEYIRMMAEGSRPFFDFIDAYGPATWVLPLSFFILSGKHELGVRLFLVILKIFIVLLTGEMVKRQANRFYGILAACMMAALWGQPWQYLQTPYAAHTSFFLVLCAWFFLISEPCKERGVNLFFASLFTALTFWTKLNSGMFLLAGGLFYLFYWLPPASTPPSGLSKRGSIVIMGIQITGLLVYGSVFHAYIAEYFNKLYFFYLSLPVLALLFWTLLKIRLEKGDSALFFASLRSWILYLSLTIVLALAMQLGYFGWEEGIRYWRELGGILSRLDYMSPFPPLGMPGLYDGYNEYYWMQLPWLVTVLFLVWLFFQKQLPFGRLYRRKWGAVQSRVTGLWLLSLLSGFAIYSRSDETHLFQAVTPAVPVLFVLLHQMEAAWTFNRMSHRRMFRMIIAGSTGLYLFTIASMPSLSFLDAPIGDWNTEHLKGIRMTTQNRYIVYMEDILANDLSRYVDQITEDWSPVLVLNENQMINYNSKTVPVGGRYQYLFYMLRSDLIDRKAFDELTPGEILKELLENPPPVIVNSQGRTGLLKHIPEFEILLETRYQKTRSFGYLFVYEKRKKG